MTELRGGRTPLSRAVIAHEMDDARAAFRLLVDTADSAALRWRSNGTRWSNRQLLFHMLFGYLIVRALRPILLLFARLPDAASHGLAAGLDAATRPFHAVNYLGSLCGGSLLSPALVATWMDRTIGQLQRRLDAETDATLELTMHFPARWDPYFQEAMSLRALYHYATQHVSHHRSQLTLPDNLGP
jgi:DinB superfamily